MIIIIMESTVQIPLQVQRVVIYTAKYRRKYLTVKILILMLFQMFNKHYSPLKFYFFS